ncbi:IS4 family transposase, partial [Pseudomonas sp. NPDC098740]
TVQVRSGYEGMQIALPPEHLSIPIRAGGLAQYLLALARNVPPKTVAKSKRGPKVPKSKEWLEGKAANAHVSTDRVLKAAKVKRP